jgi:aminopeptidase N
LHDGRIGGEGEMAHIELPRNVVPIHYAAEIAPRLEALTFKGRVVITVSVMEPTSTVIMNSVELDFLSIELRGSAVLSGSWKIDPSRQQVAITFERVVAPGRYDLAIDYAGKINETAMGLFVTRYDTPAGPRQMLLTQFEAVAARRFMPCWDEPAHKATFSISVVASATESAISNMPIDRTDLSEAGLQYIRFKKSPLMSTYLLFLGIGDLERLETHVDGVVVSVIARSGSAYKGQFALESAAQLLKYYNEYFSIPYPLPKLDLVAAPGAGGFSAMENWGAILYFEKVLLLDPALSTESDRQRVFVVVAHEMAHQWFGNLVTMQWWDNLWLNEGFASWMENKATDRFHPEWTMWLQSESARQRAMRQDAKGTTHPVVQPVPSGEQADQAFDDITYRKGQAVIRMLESYVGEDLFRQGVRGYMRRHAYGNTVTDDLWSEIAAAGGGNIKAIADDFTLQPGVPLVSVERALQEGDHVKVTVRQGRFGVDDASHQPLVWRTPVSAASAGDGNPPTTVLATGETPVEIQVKGSLPVKINVGQGAYFRSRYSDDAFSGLADKFGVLPAVDQLGLLYDAWALGEAGFMPVSAYLDLTRRTNADSDTVLWRQIIETLLSIDGLYAGLPGRAGLESYALHILKPVFARTTWDRRPGEPDNAAVLREDLIGALGRLGDRDVSAEAQRRFLNFVANPEDPRALPAAIRQPTLRIVAFGADTATYETLYGLARSATDPVAKDQYFVALASARDPSLAQRSLDLALGNDPAKTTGPSMISRVATDNTSMAWAFVLEHLSEVNARLDALQRYNFVPSIAVQSADPAMLPELRKFIDQNVPAANKKQVERFYADLEFRLSVRARRLPEIDEWIRENG